MTKLAHHFSKEDEAVFAVTMKGLRTFLLCEDPDQAIPMSKEHFYHCLAMKTSPNSLMRAAFLLCWKTASRWDEMTHLEDTNIRQISITEILIVFEFTKARQKFRADHCIMVVGSKEQISEIMTPLRGRKGLLFPWTTEQIDTMLAEWPMNETDMMQMIDTKFTKYSAHSLKRGALQEAMRLAIRGIITPEVVQHLAKHAGGLGQVLPPNTTRYVTDKTLIARLNGTQIATALL
jgi:hypothetical protein